MSVAARLIYQRRTGPFIWLFPFGAAAAAMAAGAQDRNWSGGVIASIIAIVLTIAIVWIAIGWSGRTRLAEIWLDGESLVARPSHIFDRGKTWRAPLAETSNWSALLENYDRHQLEIATFTYRGTTYVLQIDGADFADLDQLNAWIERDRPQLDGNFIARNPSANSM